MQVVDPQAEPLNPIVLARPRFARLFTGPANSLVYVDAEPTEPGNWAHPTPGPGETLVQLRSGPGLLTTYSPNADQLLYNRIGTVFNDRVPVERAGGAVLLWTDGRLDYYGVALNMTRGDHLLMTAAATISRASGISFALASPAPTLTQRFAGDPSQQWRSVQSAIAYGLASSTLGEVDITVTAATPGFVESLLGPAAVPVHGHPGWLLASQTTSTLTSYTLFWHETPAVVLVLTSDGRATQANLLDFANSLAPIGDTSWTKLAQR